MTKTSRHLPAEINGNHILRLSSSVVKPVEKATAGLARVGSRAALSFAFAFLRRAWRSGEDSDLCGELLQVGHVCVVNIEQSFKDLMHPISKNQIYFAIS